MVEIFLVMVEQLHEKIENLYFASDLVWVFTGWGTSVGPSWVEIVDLDISMNLEMVTEQTDGFAFVNYEVITFIFEQFAQNTHIRKFLRLIKLNQTLC